MSKPIEAMKQAAAKTASAKKPAAKTVVVNKTTVKTVNRFAAVAEKAANAESHAIKQPVAEEKLSLSAPWNAVPDNVSIKGGQITVQRPGEKAVPLPPGSVLNLETGKVKMPAKAEPEVEVKKRELPASPSAFIQPDNSFVPLDHFNSRPSGPAKPKKDDKPKSSGPMAGATPWSLGSGFRKI